VLWINDAENKEFCAHLKIVFSNLFSRGGNAKVCSTMKNFLFFERFQRDTVVDKIICVKFEDVETVSQLVSCTKEVELQLKMRSVAHETKSPRCYDVPDIVPQVIVWKVSSDSCRVVRAMEKIEPIEVSSKKVGHTAFELRSFQSNKMQVERFLNKHSSPFKSDQTCASQIFDFFLNLQEKNLYPIDLKVSNMGFVTGHGAFKHEISKLMFFDLGDNHFLASAGTWTPAIFRSQFGQRYSSFNIVGVPDAHAFNPVFFELHVLLLELCFASQNFVVTQDKEFRSEEFRQVKFLCRKREECVRKNPGFQ
jgi:hypothetical protein